VWFNGRMNPFQGLDEGSIPFTRSKSDKYHYRITLNAMKLIEKSEILKQLETNHSVSEENGLALIEHDDLIVFSPGISTAGFAEIRMARENSLRKIIATTIDKKGLAFADQVIKEASLTHQIETRLEDLREANYPENYFDFIYARLVLHYLSSKDLNTVLANFCRILKDSGKLFVVVRSDKNIPDRNDLSFDEETQMTSIPHYDKEGNVSYMETRYFHSPKTIHKHLEKAKFTISKTLSYQEQLYKDFMRKEISPNFDHIIEIHASKVSKTSNT
jgi:cyclopropane fatty-acyl-phospholipid synthase-like methyltransferase